MRVAIMSDAIVCAFAASLCVSAMADDAVGVFRVEAPSNWLTAVAMPFEPLSADGVGRFLSGGFAVGEDGRPDRLYQVSSRDGTVAESVWSGGAWLDAKSGATSAVRFVFAAGESLGRPDPGIHVKMDERLMMVDAAGWACTNAPVYYDLFENNGTVRRFLATDMTGARGRLVSVTDSRGVVQTSAEMGVDIVYDADGVRQLLTPSRLADVRVLDGGYEVSVYPVGDAPPVRDAATGLYPIPEVSPVRYVSVWSENGGNRAVVTFRRGEAEPEVSVFDWRQGDWSMTRASGVSEIRERSVVDSKEARTVKESRSRTGEPMARSEYNYVWKSWGFAATNHVEGFGGVTRTTSWTYVTSGNGKGQVKTETGNSGLRTDFAYDSANRLVSKTTGGADVATEKTAYSYDPVDLSDDALPVDTRPRTVVKTRDGIECERTYYVYSSLTDVVERVGMPGAPYGGANALRTVTAHYPTDVNDVCAGRVKSIRHEDGRLDIYGYALASNVWTETVTHLHERVPSPVEGRTTRDVTRTNVRDRHVLRLRWMGCAREHGLFGRHADRLHAERRAWTSGRGP